MRHAASVALFLLLPSLAAAGSLPSRYDVRGVGPGDVLNIRAEPSAAAPVVGTLAPDARGVEVMAADPSGRWGRVNANEGNGWVSLAYLTEQAAVWQSGKLPDGLHCFGTEPFWSLEPSGEQARFEQPEGSRSYEMTALDLGTDSDPRRALLLRDGETTATAAIVPQVCSDGMSDRVFGLEVLLVVSGQAGRNLFSGCCSIARQ